MLYCDNASTTRLSQKAFSAMVPWLTDNYGNPSSIHEMGFLAKKAIEDSRAVIASAINAAPREIIFTSGATESINTFVHMMPTWAPCVTSKLEHKATIEALKGQSGSIFACPNTVMGSAIGWGPLIARKENQIKFCTIIHGNNEIGTVQNISILGQFCRESDILFHVDATQTVGWNGMVDVKRQYIDAMSASAHKFGGPKGVGFLYIGERVRSSPLIVGGGQEFGMRSGTENVAGIVGMATALQEHLGKNRDKIDKISDTICNRLQEIGGFINGNRLNGVPGIINCTFRGTDAESLVLLLSGDGIYVSTGSACKANSLEPSHVLLAIGLTEEDAYSTIRISINDEFTEADAERLCSSIEEALT